VSPKPLLDIGDAEWTIVDNILRRHVPGREVWAFGSRARWTAKEFSDLDLFIQGEQPLAGEDAAALAEAFAESDLPWKVDVVDGATVSAAFRDVIERDKVVVQRMEIKNVGVEGMPTEWPLKLLENLATEITVGFVGTMADEYVGDGIPFLRSLNIKPFSINKNDLKYVSQKFHKKLSKSALRPGDVVIVRTGKPGTCSVIPSWLTEANCSDLVIVRCGPELRPKFLCYWVNSVASNHISAHLVGAVQQHFNVGAAKKMHVACPPLIEQDAILSVLGSVDDRITLLRETNATLEAMAQALFKSWFVDFDPVRAKMEGRVPEGMDEATARLFPDSFNESELRVVPIGWKLDTLSDISNVGIGKTPPRKEAQWFTKSQEDNRWVSIRDMGQQGAFLSETSESLTSEAVDRFNIRIVPNNTVMLSFKMTIGRLAISDGEMTTNEAIAHFKLDKDALVSSEFIYLTLKAFDFSSLSSTSSIADAVNSKTVKNIPILVPQQTILNAFQEKIAPLFSQLKLNAQRIRVLSNLRDTLLPRLISGQLRLPEAMKEVAAA